MKLEIKLKKAYSQLFFSLKIPLTKKMFRLILDFYPIPGTKVHGITSRCADSRHVLFFDYDKIGLPQLEQEIKYLQEYFKLGDCYIFKTGKENYHVINLEKFSILEASEILKQSSADQAFISAPKYFYGREWVLRYSEKGERKPPEYLKTILGYPNSRTISTAHKEFLRSYYKVSIEKKKKEDGITAVPITEYLTGSNVQR